jgi:hypothetical protein
LEIRQQIYHYCLVRRSPIVANHLNWDEWQFFSWGINDKVKSLLLVSKKVFQEASDVPYSSNNFQVILHGDGGYCRTKKFTKSNRLKIRKLRIVLRPMSCFYALGKMLDTELWPPILTGLTTLSIVAQQPLLAQTYWNTPSFEQDMKEWIGWTGPISCALHPGALLTHFTT